jgi:hypothetical protein
MNRKSRIHQLIEAELRRRLFFTFSMEANLSKPGSPTFHKGDLVRFKVWVRNDADIRFNKISGLLTGTVSTEFESTCFKLADLDPRQEREVATIEARIMNDPRTMTGCGWIAKLTVVADVDLSTIRIRESERFLGYTLPQAQPRNGGHVRSIPLSDAPPSLW